MAKLYFIQKKIKFLNRLSDNVTFIANNADTRIRSLANYHHLITENKIKIIFF